MPRKAQPWFRWYTEAAHDRKIRRLTPTQRWLFVAMCSAGKESPELGRLLVAADEPMTDKEVGEYADVSQREVAKALPVLDRLGMVVRDEQGVLTVVNMQHRQYASDTSAERTKNYRGRHSDGNSDSVVTSQPSHNGRHSDVVSDVPETEADTEKDFSSELRSDIENVCKHLADRIEANGSKRPRIVKSWRQSARLMLDNDERTEGQVHRMIDWCQQDTFWRANILSMPKLRDKYDQMKLKAEESSGLSTKQKLDALGFVIE